MSLTVIRSNFYWQNVRRTIEYYVEGIGVDIEQVDRNLLVEVEVVTNWLEKDKDSEEMLPVMFSKWMLIHLFE